MRSKIPSDFRKLVSSAHHQRALSRGGVLRGDADVAPKKKKNGEYQQPTPKQDIKV